MAGHGRCDSPRSASSRRVLGVLSRKGEETDWQRWLSGNTSTCREEYRNLGTNVSSAPSVEGFCLNSQWQKQHRGLERQEVGLRSGEQW